MNLYNKFFDNVYDILDKDLGFVKYNKKEFIGNFPAVFDIESSSFYIGKEKYATMYAWVFGINGKCIRGRTWEEFLTVLDRVIEFYELSKNRRIIIYIHNLAYEFQWFKHYFDWDKIFSIDERKPIYARTSNGIEFRCSYLLSNYSLATVAKNLTMFKIEKKVGDLDYKLIRHSKTPLTDLEWGYILNDGLVVMAYIYEEIDRLGTINDIPLTNTGYVRRFCRKRCLNMNKNYSTLMKNLKLDSETYLKLKEGFAGGFTHANSWWVGKDIRVGKRINNIDIKSIGSFDLTSSYPTVLLSEKFPMSKPYKIEIKDAEDLKEKLKTYCCLFTIHFHNIKEKIKFEHYLSISKCIESNNYTLDNGRIVSAEDITITITEQDYEIIKSCYTWEYFNISDFYIFYKGYLPKELIRCVIDLYKDKTTLKDVEDKTVEYMKSKSMLNSVYGMCVTDICRDEIVFEEQNGWYKNTGNVEELIQRYNNSSNRFLYYPWGVWCTAYARRNLFKLLLICKDHYIYSDTDSLKIINYEQFKPAFDSYNIEIIKKVKACLRQKNINVIYAEPKNKYGDKKPLGVWEFEYDITRFKTLGAKRYMFETKDKKLHITIAGVNKEKGLKYLYHEFKTNDKIFKNFQENLLFPAEYADGNVIENGSGKLTHTYLDYYMMGYVNDYLGNEYPFCEYSGVHLEPTSYDMSLSNDFVNYLLGKNQSWILERNLNV